MKATPIQQWYTDRSVFITGATGFMGKVLVEKLLRDLPDLNKIYMLLRPKKGLSVTERLAKIKQLEVFSRLREVNAEALNKLVIVEGGLTEENLGLSEAHKKMLIEEVSVVFHMAASLRLEAGVKDAILANTLGTKLVMDLCTQMKKIESVVHLSTAFCHCDVDILEEKVYSPRKNPYELIEYVQTASDLALEGRKQELISPHPNSYTFSKRLAETVADDYNKKLPMLIARPSIVTPSLHDPVPGWVDSLNGPVGLVVAAGKGVLRSMLCNRDNHACVIPVDIAINGLVAAGYVRGVKKESETMVYHLNVPRDIVDITWGEVLDQGRELYKKYPFEWMLWYPSGNIRTNWFIHWMIMILFQWIPAILLDGLFYLIGKERFMIRVQKKIMVGLDVLQYFTLRDWNFSTEKSVRDVSNALTPEDDEIFSTINTKFDIPTYLTMVIIGTRKYCMKEDLKTLPITRIHLKVLYVLDLLCRCAFFYFCTWFILNLFGLSDLLSLKYFIPSQGVQRVQIN